MEHIFDSASSIMTVISFVTFLGILLWTFALRSNADFATQAALPFADEWRDDIVGERHV